MESPTWATGMAAIWGVDELFDVSLGWPSLFTVFAALVTYDVWAAKRRKAKAVLR